MSVCLSVSVCACVCVVPQSALVSVSHILRRHTNQADHTGMTLGYSITVDGSRGSRRTGHGAHWMDRRGSRRPLCSTSAAVVPSGPITSEPKSACRASESARTLSGIALIVCSISIGRSCNRVELLSGPFRPLREGRRGRSCNRAELIARAAFEGSHLRAPRFVLELVARAAIASS